MLFDGQFVRRENIDALEVVATEPAHLRERDGLIRRLIAEAAEQNRIVALRAEILRRGGLVFGLNVAIRAEAVGAFVALAPRVRAR